MPPSLSHRPSTSLDASIETTSPFPFALQHALASALWGPLPERLFNGENPTQIDLAPYFSYYAEQCNQALHDGGRWTLINTHRDIIDLARLLASGSTMDTALNHILARSPVPDVEKARGSVNVAARLLTMMNFGRYRYAISSRRELGWEEGSLDECLKGYLAAKPVLGHEGVKLEKAFDARTLVKIAGLEVVLTSNLADHLRLRDDEAAVEIFPYVSFLEYQRDSGVFPYGFIDETFRTLSLLFPQSEQKTQRWFQRFCDTQPGLVDSRLVKCGQLRADDRQIENFHFWHDRIVMLKQVYDEARPRNVSQWWNDRRNGVQWYTFWVAVLVLVLTVFFGLVQSIEGALQVYKAYYPSK